MVPLFYNKITLYFHLNIHFPVLSLKLSPHGSLSAYWMCIRMHAGKLMGIQSKSSALGSRLVPVLGLVLRWLLLIIITKREHHYSSLRTSEVNIIQDFLNVLCKLKLELKPVWRALAATSTCKTDHHQCCGPGQIFTGSSYRLLLLASAPDNTIV